MKILLSAYACEPNKGSEPGVGWNWAIELAKRGHDVWVLTRANNRHSIEKELTKSPSKSNLHFLYYDLPVWVMRLKKLPGGIYFYYSVWQFGAYTLAKKKHGLFRYDIVHHVTFVSIRLPSFMGNLNTRFIFGPLAGGEKAPWRLRMSYPLRGAILDFLRDIGNFFVRFNPINHLAFTKAESIYVTSQQTKALIPDKFKPKTKIKLAIGISEKWCKGNIELPSEKSSIFKILYVGHFLYLKGMHLGLRAIAEVIKSFPDIQLTLVGEGPEESDWKKQALQLGIASKTKWIPWVPKQDLIKLYQTHQLFLFPSLHDSGGMVVLEALSQGLPVVCLDLGGPGVIIDDSCGIKITTHKRNEKKIIKDLSTALLKLLNDPDALDKLRKGALNKSSGFSWKHIINDIYE